MISHRTVKKCAYFMRSGDDSPEAEVVASLVERASKEENAFLAAIHPARSLVEDCRSRKSEHSILDQFLLEFGLTTKEGVALLCICEALLRIPDAATAEALIADKLASADWESHLGQSDSLFINASTWALLLSGSVVRLDARVKSDPANWLRQTAKKLGESAIRQAMAKAVQILSGEFVFADSIDTALRRVRSDRKHYSFDVLGEGAVTLEAADEYFQKYLAAIKEIGDQTSDQRLAMSVKLTALYPRVEPLQQNTAVDALVARVGELAQEAAKRGTQFTIDAEEQERLEISLRVFKQLAESANLSGWNGLGLAVQAYSKRALPVLSWLRELSATTGHTLSVRLVKGAYWDAEIKHAQEQGLRQYPVFTRKVHTDVSWLSCAEFVLAADGLFPQFATHNAYSIAAVMSMAKHRDFEFQRLHGMGELLYDVAASQYRDLPAVRTYAPIGDQKNLLAYLVRRLLENGANTSFVHRLLDAKQPVAEVIKNPFVVAEDKNYQPHPRLPLPTDLFKPARSNSVGFDFGNLRESDELKAALDTCDVSIKSIAGASDETIDRSFEVAMATLPKWQGIGAHARRELALNLAKELESNKTLLLRMLQVEAKKTIGDAYAELREAIDFCNYYAAESRKLFTRQRMPGPTGESNVLHHVGRGTFVCISPWNFPLAIFLGQSIAALLAGNTVVAKPAEQTSAIADLCVDLMTKAGFPSGVFNVVHGESAVGRKLVQYPGIAGVAFTGSTAVAKEVSLRLASKDGPIVPFIAETGGQNAMVVDSSVLFEQVVKDVLHSAFQSTGQRCSALRVLCVQQDIADELVAMIVAASRTLVIGDSSNFETDLGPVIDAASWQNLRNYIDSDQTAVRFEGVLPDEFSGTHIPPTIVDVDSLANLGPEQFGPILHVYRFKGNDWEKTLTDIVNLGYGLTFGIQTRIESKAQRAAEIVAAGNTYINRNMIGAVVGVQPFGGHGLSGTGPKAGGPNYLRQFTREQTISTNLVATGGNADLLSLGD